MTELIPIEFRKLKKFFVKKYKDVGVMSPIPFSCKDRIFVPDCIKEYNELKNYDKLCINIKTIYNRQKIWNRKSNFTYMLYSNVAFLQKTRRILHDRVLDTTVDLYGVFDSELEYLKWKLKC